MSEKKCLIMPDSFKGTLTAIEATDIMESAINQSLPCYKTEKIPIADGGEGTAECFIAAVKGQWIPFETSDPYGMPLSVRYGVSPGTAVIETAMAAGLPLVEGRLNTAETTSLGVGLIVRDAVSKGYQRIILGLGGSCTTDGGAGLAAALGVKFFDENGTTFLPVGKTLNRIKVIDVKAAKKFLQDTELILMCDVENPLYGPKGAAYVFSPQKGADEAMVQLLDMNLRHYSHVIKDQLGVDVSQLKGGGAAGGIGAGAFALLGGKLQSGINVLLDIISFESRLEHCDFIITGEGKFDSQSLDGKVVAGIGRRAKEKAVPVIVVAGLAPEDIGKDKLEENGIFQVVSLYEYPLPMDVLRDTCRQALRDTVTEKVSQFLEIRQCCREK